MNLLTRRPSGPVLLFASLWACFAPVLAVAAPNEWVSIGPDGGLASNIVVQPGSDSVALAATVGGVFRSTDGGLTWTMSSLAIPPIFSVSNLAFDPTDAQRVYAVAGRKVLRSTDGGLSFTETAEVDESNSLHGVAVASDGSRVYVGGATAGVFVSTDGALTFARSTTGFPTAAFSTLAFVSRVVTPPGAPLQAWALTGVGPVLTTDGGQTWQMRDNGIPINHRASYDLLFDPADPATMLLATNGGVYRSTDGGSTWGSSSPTFITVRSLARDPANSNLIVAGTDNGGTYRSTDGGSAWTQDSASSQLSIWSTAFIAPNTLLVGSTADLLRVVNGSSWQPVSGIRALSVGNLTQHPGDAARLFATISAAGLYQSTDAGSTWGPIDVGLSATSMLNSDWIRLAIHPTQPDKWFLSTSTPRRSADGGATWSPYFVINGGRDVAIAPSDPNRVYLATQNGLYRSINGGANMSRPEGSFDDSAVYAVAVHPTDANTVLVAGEEGLFRSTDGGQQFVQLFDRDTYGDPTRIVFDPTDPQRIHVALTSHIHGYRLSTDGGATWTTHNAGMAEVITPYLTSLALNPQDPREVLAGTTAGGVYRSLDGGRWEHIGPLVAFQGALSVMFDAIDDARIYAGLGSQSISQYDVATDLAVRAIATSERMADGAGAEFRYTIENLGGHYAKDVEVLVSIPAALVQPSVSLAGGTCTVSGSVHTCRRRVVAAGTIVPLTVNFIATGANTTPSVQVGVSAREADLDHDNSSVRSQFLIEEARGPDLSVSLTGGASSIQVGKLLKLSFSVTNTGPDAATASSFTLQVPSLLKAGKAKVAKVKGVKGMKCTKGATVHCTFGALPVGQTRRGTITLKAGKVAGTATLTATVAGSPTDPDASDNSTTRSVTITPKN